jgi:NADH-quinone oxidoreductase subunit M
LLGTRLAAPVAMVLMLGFFAGFAVKLPVFPFHTWAPDAYAAAPTAATVVLSGLMAKTAGYGLLRFLVPLFPDAAATVAPVAMALGALGIVYGAWLAFAQTDIKRLVAYSSVSHMGFVAVGAFAWNEWAVQGALVVMLAHGISSAAMFIVAGALEARLGRRDLPSMGGLWAVAPRLSGLGLLFALASLGLPGLGNFVGEFLVLLGAYRENPFLAAIGTIGILFATVYALWMVQQAFHGPTAVETMPDLGPREALVLGALALATVTLGLFPQPVLDAARPAFTRLQQAAPMASAEPAAPGFVVEIPAGQGGSR